MPTLMFTRDLPNYAFFITPAFALYKISLTLPFHASVTSNYHTPVPSRLHKLCFVIVWLTRYVSQTQWYIFVTPVL